MQIGIVGMGKMGANMAQRLLEHGHEVVVFDRNPPKVEAVARLGATGAKDVGDLVARLSSPKVVWVMVQAGEATEAMLGTVGSLLNPGDILIDGGNSNFRDSIRRGQQLAEKGIRFVDAGTSGGIWGLKNGYCIMAGGEPSAVETVRPVMEALAPPEGFLHVGPVGSGHFVKMIHNGIEYGLLQAYGEGFELLKSGPFDLDLGAISHLWNHGSVVRSWLLELLEEVLTKDYALDNIRGYVADSGEGRWTVQEAINASVPAPVITMALYARFASRQDDSYSAKVIAALRTAFGGHAVETK